MVVHICITCKREFNKKSNYVKHTKNKKNPCVKDEFNVPQNSTIVPQNSTILLNNLIDELVKEPEPKSNKCTCMYCEKIFARIDSLQRHLNGTCKSKVNYDELDKLKKDMKLIIQNYQKIENNYQNLENENVNLKKEIDEIKIIQIGGNKNNKLNITNNINNNQINNGVIQNNTVNIQLVQFGNEDISKLNLVDAMKSYLKSTGGNIASSMLKYINLNEQYPENNNICMTDLSREIVKIHDGKKFVYKKFKNVKDEILTKIVKNTRKIVSKYETDETLKKSVDTKMKLKINDISLKIIDGISAEDIVREEIKEKEKLLIKNKIVEINKKNDAINKKNDDLESEEEREFTLEERLRIEHLENKREGMQKKTFENIKTDLYNAKELTENIN